MTPLKLGFIGGGINSAVGRAHYSACRMDGRFEVVAGCFSRDKANNVATGKVFNAYVFDKVEWMLEMRSLIDAVVVLTPTPSHFEIVRDCLMTGVPVICEKALTATSKQAADLIEFQWEKRYSVPGDTSARFLAVTYNYTGYPMVRELRDIVQTGALGKIISIQAEMPQEGYLRMDAHPQNWRLEDGRIPGVHLDLGTHLHHMIYFLTGQHPKAVLAHQQKRSEFGVVDEVNCLAEYEGFNANLWFGKTALGHRNGLRIRIYGTQGLAEWHQMNPEDLQRAMPSGNRFTEDRSSIGVRIANHQRYQRFKAGHPQGWLEALANLYTDLADTLELHKSGISIVESSQRGTIPELYGAEVAHAGLVMMENMVKSAKERRWV